jgi:hypothetical protein
MRGRRPELGCYAAENKYDLSISSLNKLNYGQNDTHNLFCNESLLLAGNLISFFLIRRTQSRIQSFMGVLLASYIVYSYNV